jgi:FixJ family two-component response regulator
MTPNRPASPAPTVHLVEDDPSSRTATVRLLKMAGYEVREYTCAAELLDAAPVDAGCLVLDLQLPGLSGLDTQEALVASGNPLPIVFLTGHGDIPQSVQAMKAGAIDFLSKPVAPETLLEAVTRALARDAESRAVRDRRSAIKARYERLTPREREVFAHLISGQLNKQAAFDLGTTEHTIKVHRRRVMDKLEADSLADLVRFAADLGIAPVGQVK